MTKQDNSKPQASVAPADTAATAPALGPAPTSGPPAPGPVHEAEAPREAKSRNGLVVASIMIVSLAAAVMSFSQLGLALSISAGIGVVTLALLMLIHNQMQKSAQIAQLQVELAQSRQMARAKQMPRMAPAPAPVSQPSAQASTEARIRELSRDIGNMAPRADVGPPLPGSAAAPSAIASELERAVRKQPRAPHQAPPSEQPTSEPANFGPPAPHNEELGASPQGPQGDIVREQWSFRPRTDAQATVQDASAAVSGGIGGAAPARAPVTTTVEGDLELVQRKIKELADEVNAAEALRPKLPRANVRPKSEPSALEDSIGALRAAAKSMRQRPSLGDFVPKFEAPVFPPNAAPAPSPAPSAEAAKEGFGELVIPATAERIAGSDSAPSLPDFGDREPPSLDLPLPDFGAIAASAPPSRSVAIARAVEDDAVDVLLGPIVTLAQHSVTHYEMSAHLRDEAGEHLNATEEDFALAGGDAGSQFDVARLNRAAALAARMDARDRDGSLLAEFLGSSMTSRAFLESFAQAYEARQRISAQLVLTFSQRAVDEFSPAAWQAVRDMHAFGFRLALDKVQHMRSDFASLQRSGFRFVRLDSQALLNGMTASDRFVPAEEIVQRATLAGLSIIASGIQDAAVQKRLLEAGILLGQGPLFGAPRQVNVDSGGAGPTDQSAAA